MSRASERRAALAAAKGAVVVGDIKVDGASTADLNIKTFPDVKLPTDVAQLDTIASVGALVQQLDDDECEEDFPMTKLYFDSVRLEFEIPRFTKAGWASTTSSHIESKAGVTIELNVATGMLRLSQGALVRNIPRERVLFFGDEVPAPKATTNGAVAQMQESA